jgi:hypothetical protein
MRTAAYLALPALLLSSAGLAQTANNGTDGAKVQKVCKREARTNSRFQTSICHTPAEWKEIEEQARRDAKEMIDRPVIETRRGG